MAKQSLKMQLDMYQLCYNYNGFCELNKIKSV